MTLGSNLTGGGHLLVKCCTATVNPVELTISQLLRYEKTRGLPSCDRTDAERTSASIAATRTSRSANAQYDSSKLLPDAFVHPRSCRSIRASRPNDIEQTSVLRPVTTHRHVRHFHSDTVLRRPLLPPLKDVTKRTSMLPPAGANPSPKLPARRASPSPSIGRGPLFDASTVDAFPSTPDEEKKRLARLKEQEKRRLAQLEEQYQRDVVMPIAKLWTKVDASPIFTKTIELLTLEALEEGRAAGLVAHAADLRRIRRQQIDRTVAQFVQTNILPLETRLEAVGARLLDYQDRYKSLRQAIEKSMAKERRLHREEGDRLYRNASKVVNWIAETKSRTSSPASISRELGSRIKGGQIHLSRELDHRLFMNIQAELRQQGRWKQSPRGTKPPLVSEPEYLLGAREPHLAISLVGLYATSANLLPMNRPIPTRMHQLRAWNFVRVCNESLPEVLGFLVKDAILAELAMNIEDTYVEMYGIAARLLAVTSFTYDVERTTRSRLVSVSLSGLRQDMESIRQCIGDLQLSLDPSLQGKQFELRKRQVINFTHLRMYTRTWTLFLRILEEFIDVDQELSTAQETTFHPTNKTKKVRHTVQKILADSDMDSPSLRSAFDDVLIWNSVAFLHRPDHRYDRQQFARYVKMSEAYNKTSDVSTALDEIRSMIGATPAIQFTNLPPAWWTPNQLYHDSNPILIDFVLSPAHAESVMHHFLQSKVVALDVVWGNFRGIHELDSNRRMKYLLLATRRQVAIIFLPVAGNTLTHRYLYSLIRLFESDSILKICYEQEKIRRELEWSSFVSGLGATLDLKPIADQTHLDPMVNVPSADGTHRILKALRVDVPQVEGDFFSTTSKISPEVFFQSLATRPLALMELFHRYLTQRRPATTRPEIESMLADSKIDHESKLGPVNVRTLDFWPPHRRVIAKDEFPMLDTTNSKFVTNMVKRLVQRDMQDSTRRPIWVQFAKRGKPAILRLRAALSLYYRFTLFAEPLRTVAFVQDEASTAAQISWVAKQLDLFLSSYHRRVLDSFKRESEMEISNTAQTITTASDLKPTTLTGVSTVDWKSFASEKDTKDYIEGSVENNNTRDLSDQVEKPEILVQVSSSGPAIAEDDLATPGPSMSSAGVPLLDRRMSMISKLVHAQTRLGEEEFLTSAELGELTTLIMTANSESNLVRASSHAVKSSPKSTRPSSIRPSLHRKVVPAKNAQASIRRKIPDEKDTNPPLRRVSQTTIRRLPTTQKILSQLISPGKTSGEPYDEPSFNDRGRNDGQMHESNEEWFDR